MYVSALLEEEEYKPTGANRLFEYDSDESINTCAYGHEPYTLPPPFQPMPNFAQYNSNEYLFYSPQITQRRHSSYSNEDILQMKYQNPPVDPRYRDTRQFVKSNSNIYDHVRRDFMSRRRSSSSLQEDILRPFQLIQMNEYLRKSSPTMNRTRSNSPNALSDKSNSNSNWNLNPSILIEEYDDRQIEVEVKSNNSSNNLSCTNEVHQPLNEESVAGGNDIPFIDDEHDHSTATIVNVPCDTFTYVDMQRQQQPTAGTTTAAAAAADFVNKNRKTVSFDLMDSMDELNRIRLSNVALNKSNTCDHLIGVRTNNCRMPTPCGVCNVQCPNSDAVAGITTTVTNEPIFKFCTWKKSSAAVTPPTNERTESFNQHPPVVDHSLSDCSCFHNDNSSAYFGDSVNEHRTDRRCGRRSSSSIVDAKTMNLDLSDLQSDSTNSSNDPRSNSNGFGAKPSKFAYITAWKPPVFFDKIHFGQGKVQALRNYFERMKFPVDVVAPTSQSTPDLSASTEGYCTQKLNAAERQKVLEQLQEWSEFGTSDRPKCKDACVATSQPIMRSVLNLTVTASFNDNSPTDANTYTAWQSAPDVREHKKFPDAYIVRRRQKIHTNIDTNSHDWRKSCPELDRTAQPKPFIISSKLKTNIHSSPCHRSNNQTLRRIKQHQKANRMAKCCRHRSDARTNSRCQQTDAADDGGANNIEPR